MDARGWAAAIAGVAMAGCVSYRPVPLSEGKFERNAVRVGEDVRAETRSGEELAFRVTAVEEGALTGDEGESVVAGDLRSLEVRRMNKTKTIVFLSVLGGVVGTALILDELDDCSYSDGDVFCAD